MDKIFFLPAVKSIVHIKDLSIDNTVFRLHYRVTALFLIVASLMISATQFFGDPIKCVLHKDYPVGVIESYCWVESTFTLPKALDKKVGHEVPYPGVDKHVEGDDVIKHAYYQWVCLMLFLQGCLFYIPHVLWKSWEGGRISSLISALNQEGKKDMPKHFQAVTVPRDVRSENYKSLATYFLQRRESQGDYFFKFFLCEIMNFVNVVGQIFLTDRFLGGEFTTYGSEVFQFMMEEQEDRHDPMVRVFPRMTKCTFHHYGPSGDVQKLDTFCVLPLNILNEKIYVFMWFWFVLLAIITGLTLVYRLVMILSPTMRFFIIRSTNFLTDKDKLGYVLSYMDYGDWFVLYMFGSNIDNIYFMDIVDELADKIQETPMLRRTGSTGSTDTVSDDPKA